MSLFAVDKEHVSESLCMPFPNAAAAYYSSYELFISGTVNHSNSKLFF